MKIHLVGVELFHADGQTQKQTGRSKESLFTIFRKRPIKIRKQHFGESIGPQKNYMHTMCTPAVFLKFLLQCKLTFNNQNYQK